ncbi:MAG: sigma-70 family RNA polymerase sigma factor [Patescibacteria group bacterium]|jgi:RNA polymerase sigma-70 factor (ECF subfamily)
MQGSEHLTTSDDRALLERLLKDPTVVGEVYDRYANPLYGYLLKRCGHTQTAEDLVSKTFLKLLESRTKLEWRGVSLGAWLYRVASNALVDHWRTASVRLDDEVDPDSWDPPSDDNPAWNAEIVFESERMRETMKTLSPRDQEVLTLKFYGGYEAAEIAGALGISPNHAAVLVYRALARLREKHLPSTPSL